MSKLTDQQRIVQRCALVVREDRARLVRAWANLRQRGRQALASPKVLIAIFGLGLGSGYMARRLARRAHRPAATARQRTAPAKLSPASMRPFFALGLSLGQFLDRSRATREHRRRAERTVVAVPPERVHSGPEPSASGPTAY